MIPLSIIFWLFLAIIIFKQLVRILNFIEAKLDISFLEIIEVSLCESGWRRLEIAARAIVKLLTTEGDKRKQIFWMEKCVEAETHVHSILQRDIYLLEKRDDLLKKRDSPYKEALFSTRHPELYQSLKNTEEELGNIRIRYWEAIQKLSSHLYQAPEGAWVRERLFLSADEWWDMQATTCRRKGGCCYRKCQCCKYVRKGRAGQKGRICPEAASHCTMNCGCCIRFYDLCDEERDGMMVLSTASSALK